MRRFYLAVVTCAVILAGCGEGGGSGGSSQSGSTANKGGTGVGGSMARFTISGDKLYTLNNRTINVFDIAIPDQPLFEISQPVPYDVETLHAYGDYLYVGASSGVYIYDHNLDRVGRFTHLRSCDPVVIEDGIAYVTLSSGGFCRVDGGENSLEFLDVSDPIHPRYIGKKNMVHPTGIAVDGDKLFVCDGPGGLKLFDLNVTRPAENNESNASDSNSSALPQVALTFDRAGSQADIDCYDLIAHKNLLVVSNGDDVRQFDYSHLPMAPLGDIK